MKLFGSLLLLLAGYGRSDNESQFRKRQLSYEWIAGYEPRTLVKDHLAIDLDQAEMERLLTFRRLDAFKAIYEKGGHSQSIARVTLVDAMPPVMPIASLTIVLGRTGNGDMVRGRLVEEVSWTSDDKEVDVLVQYEATEAEDNFVGCQVGGLVDVNQTNQDGCLAQNGTIQILDLQKDAPAYHFQYSYEPQEDNFNGRTIQKFSTDAEEEMQNCINCPFPEYSKFVKYYDAYDYGDQFIQAALKGKATTFANGNADFTDHNRSSRVEALKVASKFMNIYMYVIRMMEHSLDQCRLVCGRRCDDSPLRAWDQAVAFYSGSLEGESGSGEGLLLYDLADRMCVLFRTCGDDATLDVGTSYVNNQVMEEFTKAQSHLMKRECDAVVDSKERIIQLMAVPLVQASLYTAFLQSSYPATTEEEAAMFKAESASFAASVLPIVHHCHKEDATTIHDNLGLISGGDSVVDFRAVKYAFEHSYNCMGVTCDAVGGIWVDKEYIEFAAPCRGAPEAGSSTPGGIVAIVICSVVFVFGVSLAIMIRVQNGRDLKFEEEAQAQEAAESSHIEDVFEDTRID